MHYIDHSNAYKDLEAMRPLTFARAVAPVGLFHPDFIMGLLEEEGEIVTWREEDVHEGDGTGVFTVAYINKNLEHPAGEGGRKASHLFSIRPCYADRVPFVAEDWIGACYEEDAEAFMEGPYYPDMKRNVLRAAYRYVRAHGLPAVNALIQRAMALPITSIAASPKAYTHGPAGVAFTWDPDWLTVSTRDSYAVYPLVIISETFVSAYGPGAASMLLNERVEGGKIGGIFASVDGGLPRDAVSILLVDPDGEPVALVNMAARDVSYTLTGRGSRQKRAHAHAHGLT